jgi:hypothetical protein
MVKKIKYNFQMYIYIILLIFLILFIFQYRTLRKTFTQSLLENFTSQSSKPKLWCYWETLPGKKKPGYIDLCYDSIRHNCSNCFDVILLDEKKIKTYLPEMKDIKNIDHLSIPHKTDYYRYALLEKYGGVWVDADIIVTRCLCPLYKELLQSDKDYMGFGCGRNRTSCSRNPDGKYNPTNWLMMSKPKSDFMKCVRENAKSVIEEKDNNFSYHEIGKVGLQKCIQKMQDQDSNWDYIHTPSTCQEYDHKGNKLNNILAPYDVKECSKKRYFFPLYNTAPGYPDWFKDLSKEDLMNGNGPEKYYLHEILDEAFSKKNTCL